MKAVANSTPLIALALTDHVALLKALFDQVFIPASVYEEVVLKGRNRPGVSFHERGSPTSVNYTLHQIREKKR